MSGIALSKLKGVPFILEVADIWTDSIRGTGSASGKIYNLLRLIESYLYRNSDAIIVLTNAFKEEVVRRGVDINKVFVVRNGINKDLFDHTKSNIDIVNRYSLQDKIVVGYIGSLGAAQGLENVIEAARIAHDAGQDNIVFMLVGNGAEKEYLVSLSMGLSNVIFVPGQPKDAVVDYLPACDVGLVHLKNDDVFSKVIPSKIFEMMAMGLPILLVSPDGEASEIVNSNNIGVWVHSGSPRLIIDALSEMISNDDVTRMYSDNCLRSIDMFSREKQARNVISVVNTVIA